MIILLCFYLGDCTYCCSSSDGSIPLHRNVAHLTSALFPKCLSNSPLSPLPLKSSLQPRVSFQPWAWAAFFLTAMLQSFCSNSLSLQKSGHLPGNLFHAISWFGNHLTNEFSSLPLFLTFHGTGQIIPLIWNSFLTSQTGENFVEILLV